MKTLITLILTLIHLWGLYPATATVTDLDYERDIVTVENANGYTYQYYGCEDYAEGDLVSMIVYSNGTDDITDDEILMVYYSGYTR